MQTEVIKYRGYEIAVMKVGFYVRILGMYLKTLEAAKKQIDKIVNSHLKTTKQFIWQ